MGCCNRKGGGAGTNASLGNRTIYGNQPAKNVNEQYTDNVVITSNYTALNFVPVFLYQQFSRFANAYFLLVCVLQMVPSITITAGVPTTLVPLGSVLLFDAVLTAVEDYRRHQDDELNNSRPVLVMGESGQFEKRTWRDVKVGDVLKVYNGETFPADLLFLRAFTTDGSAPNQCYVMTAQLDGETNLKLKQALDESTARLVNDAAAASFRGVCDAEAPNGFFNKFTGTLKMSPSGPGLPLSADQSLLRGCVLRNVDHVYAMVVYTGDQTKIRVKQTQKVFKKASVEAIINRNILLLVAMLLCICATGTILFVIFATDLQKHTYLDMHASLTFLAVFEKLCTFFLLNNALIPVSLYVTMKMARQAQKWFMEWDVDMYFEDEQQLRLTNGREGAYPMRVRSMDLNDELGQISHVFSDKTGTFTLNYMEFRKMCVRGVSYGLGTTQIGLDRLKRLGRDTSALEGLMERAEATPNPVPHVNFTDGSDSHPPRSVKADLNNGGAAQEALHFFLLHLVLNHSVVIEKVRNDDGEVVGQQLSASSPDEEAFIRAGEYFGYKFVARQNNKIKLNVRGRDMVVDILHTLAYNQMRKRMSVIVRIDNRIVLFMKGADNVLYRALRAGASTADQAVRQTTMQQLNSWGGDGLRTLVFAYKVWDAAQYSQWDQRYRAAVGSIEELTKKKNKQPNAIDQLMEMAEKNLTLQGATANEDKLQPFVPETIERLADAGMAIWMLTGDKEETAINIGWSTRMLQNGMQQVALTATNLHSDEMFLRTLQRKAEEFRSGNPAHRAPSALIIDEKYLDVALNPKSPDVEANKANLLTVASASKAVICCRCRPDQKAAMVKLIREGIPGTRTLAVGDGANDVDMIQMAHVGVGIAGAEGVQAANASDYAIGRFYFLQRLLLVHGRWNYRRMSKLVLYMFYKNIAFVLTQFWYSMYTGWSGQKYYIELATQTFNLVYTGFPIILLALFDQDVSAESALKFPVLYRDGPVCYHLNTKTFWGWVVSAIFESLLTFFACVFAMNVASVDGVSPSIFELGVVAFNTITIVVSVRVALETHWHHWMYSVLLFLSVLSLLPCFELFDFVNANGMRGGVNRMYGSWSFIMLVPVVMAATQIRIVFWKMWKRYFRTEPRHVVQEAELVTHKFKPLERAVSDSKRRLIAATAGSGAGAGAGADHEAANPLYQKLKAKRRVC